MLLTMYRIILTNDQRAELRQRTRQRDRAPSTRDRLEMVRLADAGWSGPRIARHLGQHEQTVRTWLKAFLDRGFDALRNKPRGGKSSVLTPAILDAVRTELDKAARTWTAPQLTDWLAEHHDVHLSVDRVRRHLRRAGLSWQRTSRSLKHKQDPTEVAERQAVLDDLAKRGTWASSTSATSTRRASP
jgi:putative transposase